LHAIRIEAERGSTVEPSRALDDLVQGCTERLHALYEEDQGNLEGPTLKLRSLFRSAQETLGESRESANLVIHLDELVNAINTATELAHTLAS
jgi:hypothetical protein